MELIVQPATSDRLGEHIKKNLLKDWTHFRAAVAFVKRSSTRHIITELADFAKGKEVEIVVGIDQRGTSTEGLGDLLQAVKPTGWIIELHNRLPFTLYSREGADAWQAHGVEPGGESLDALLWDNTDASAIEPSRTGRHAPCLGARLRRRRAVRGRRSETGGDQDPPCPDAAVDPATLAHERAQRHLRGRP